MGKLLFGKDETTTCIVDIAAVGRDHEPLCLAYKTTKTFIAAGVWMKDDGYVLRPRAESVSGHGKGLYYPLSSHDITLMQQDGDLPTPLPAYSIPATEWAAATSLYWIVALVVLFSAVVGRFKRRWREGIEKERRDRRVSFGPPSMHTKADRVIAERIRPHLRLGERVMHQAEGLDRHPDDGGIYARPLCVAMTSQRILFLQDERLVSLDRDELAFLRTDDELFTFVMEDGAEHPIFLGGTRQKGSNGRAFLLDVPRILAGEVHEPSIFATT